MGSPERGRSYSIHSICSIFEGFVYVQSQIRVDTRNFQRFFFFKYSASVSLERAIRQWMFKMNTDNHIDPYPQYDVLISILNPRPDIQHVQWNIRSAIDCKFYSQIFN